VAWTPVAVIPRGSTAFWIATTRIWVTIPNPIPKIAMYAAALRRDPPAPSVENSSNPRLIAARPAIGNAL
jgi:hypothetical protein